MLKYPPPHPPAMDFSLCIGIIILIKFQNSSATKPPKQPPTPPPNTPTKFSSLPLA